MAHISLDKIGLERNKSDKLSVFFSLSISFYKGAHLQKRGSLSRFWEEASITIAEAKESEPIHQAVTLGRSGTCPTEQFLEISDKLIGFSSKWGTT